METLSGISTGSRNGKMHSLRPFCQQARGDEDSPNYPTHQKLSLAARVPVTMRFLSVSLGIPDLHCSLHLRRVHRQRDLGTVDRERL
jgi:hypothetical protein